MGMYIRICKEVNKRCIFTNFDSNYVVFRGTSGNVSMVNGIMGGLYTTGVEDILSRPKWCEKRTRTLLKNIVILFYC